MLDGDHVRQLLSKGLGFSREDRVLNIKRIGYVASEIVKAGGIVLACPIAPHEEARVWARDGLLKGLTGLDDPYETPEIVELTIDTGIDKTSVADACQKVVDWPTDEFYWEGQADNV